MKHSKVWSSMAACIAAAFGRAALAADTPQATAVTLPAKEQFHLFLLVGQSNMAGRGTVEPQDEVPKPHVLMLNRDKQWVPAVDPLHFDKPGAGVGPGRAFGLALAERDPQITIGLIPCAAGGSPIAVWEPGQTWAQTQSHPYDDAVRRARAAMASGVLKGILWHQGESDCNSNKAAIYPSKLEALVARLRTDLQAPDVPFLAGELATFAGKPSTPAKDAVNAALRALPQTVPRTGFVPAEGLTDRGDKLHFDAKSAREFGRRYAEIFFSIGAAAPPAGKRSVGAPVAP